MNRPEGAGESERDGPGRREPGGDGERTTAAAAFLEGVRDVAPMVLAVGPFGAVAGLAAVASGLSFVEAIALSALVNAGASQLAALQLINQGSPVVVVLATTLFVNLRFLMYSLALSPALAGIPRWWRAVMAHMLVDQTFALASRRFAERPAAGHRLVYFLGLGLPLIASWITGSMLGAALGAQVPAAWALDFTIPLIFLALLVPAIRDRPALVAAVTGGGVSLLALSLPLNLGLMAGALCGIGAGVASERRWQG